MTDYERLPTESADDLLLRQRPHSPSSEPPPRKGAFKRRKILFGAFAVLATLFLGYKLGQYSVREPVPNPPTPSSPAQSTPAASSSTDVASTPLPTKPSSPDDKKNQTMHGKKSVAYFVNWGIYGRKYLPSYIPVNDLTHILYAFANINADSGAVTLSDAWADQDIHYPGDSWNIPPGETHLFGNFKALYLLKKEHRHLKLLLSIGGWTYSPSIHPVVVDPAKRAEFVRTSVELLDNYGLDGLDVDYEYPQNAEQAAGYVSLLQELRHALDQRQSENGDDCRFLLTIAAPCGPQNIKQLRISEMDQYLDFWNLMAYDYAGSWHHEATHQANMFGEGISTHAALELYTGAGVSSDKLIIGIPVYGRSFTNTDGPGHPFNGVGEGTWEKGSYDYRTLPLPLPNTHVYHDDNLMASWSYDPSTREMITFDTPEVARLKAEFIKDNGLGGSMFWELSGDKMPADTATEEQHKAEREGKEREGGNGGPGKQVIPGESLVRVVKHAMTGHTDGGLEGLDTSHNWLYYPRSKFDNLRAGMPN